ncbi:MAG TPA: Ldh family oxidoreductase [Chthonomonadaceae bacterium]|nr:Ldh family oxidoreductase [Chthonomonadaceae bacterium]
MNKPPTEFTRIDPDALRDFVRTVFERVGVPTEQAAFLAGLLVTNDLRGVFSHGTQQVAHYVEHFQEGRLNPAPAPRLVQETPTTLIVDGDGGLGYFPAYQAATLLGLKAQEMGLAAAATRNHGHIGAAGIYARIPLERDLFCYVTSGHQLHLQPGHNVLYAAGGSPMAFALPAGQEPPLVLDFGAMHDLYPNSPNVNQVLALAPGTVFRSFGLGCVCQALGGFLCGVPANPERAQRRWPGANQGSFMIAVDLSRFCPLDQFKQEMDEYARQVRQMQPAPGSEKAVLPGGLEWEREQQYRAEGIPVGPRHRQRLQKLAQEFDLPLPLPKENR